MAFFSLPMEGSVVALIVPLFVNYTKSLMLASGVASNFLYYPVAPGGTSNEGEEEERSDEMDNSKISLQPSYHIFDSALFHGVGLKVQYSEEADSTD